MAGGVVAVVVVVVNAVAVVAENTHAYVLNAIPAPAVLFPCTRSPRLYRDYCAISKQTLKSLTPKLPVVDWLVEKLTPRPKAVAVVGGDAAATVVYVLAEEMILHHSLLLALSQTVRRCPYWKAVNSHWKCVISRVVLHRYSLNVVNWKHC